MRYISFLAGLASLAGAADAAFGLTTTDTTFKVDTNGGLVFEVSKYVRDNDTELPLAPKILTNRAGRPATSRVFSTMASSTRGRPRCPRSTRVWGHPR